MVNKIMAWTDVWNRFLANITPTLRKYIKNEKIFLLKNITKNSVVIDIGCGYGQILKALSKKANKVVGIDINKETLGRALKATSQSKNVELFNEDCRKTHFEDSYFDYCVATMNTFGNLGKGKIPVLKEMVRITKPDGKIFISVYSENALNERLKSYSKAGFAYKILNKEKGAIKLFSSFDNKETIITEQFTRKNLIKLFIKINQKNFKIIQLGDVSYMCVITVKK